MLAFVLGLNFLLHSNRPRDIVVQVIVVGAASGFHKATRIPKWCSKRDARRAMLSRSEKQLRLRGLHHFAHVFQSHILQV